MTATDLASDRPGSGRDLNPQLEPLLWLQLLGIGAISGEGLALLIVLGSVDPGPLPGLERILAWALGALAPAVLLWKRPADPWSLLLLQAPLRGRREIQRRLMRLQESQVLRLVPLLGALLLLPVLWKIDQIGGLAAGFSPLSGSNRLVVLLLSVPLLAAIVWQWQQLWQALWLLTRPADAIAAASPLSLSEQEQQRLSLGIPLLLLNPLQAPAASQPSPQKDVPPQAAPGTVPDAPVEPEADPQPESERQLEPDHEPKPDPQPESEHQPEPDHEPKPDPQPESERQPEPETEGEPERETKSEPALEPEPEPEGALEPSGSAAIEPEQTAADGEGGDLDQEIAELDP